MKREVRVEIFVVFAVCRAIGDLSEHAFCPLHILIAMLRGRPPFRYFPRLIRAGRRCRSLKACCGIKLGLGWFRHTKGRLLHFKSDTLRVGPPLQLAMVLRGLSFCLEAGKLQIGNLRADDSHTFKPRCVPGDFLSWFVPTKVFIPVLTCRIDIEGDVPVYTFEDLTAQLSTWHLVKGAKQHQPMSPSSSNSAQKVLNVVNSQCTSSCIVFMSLVIL